MDTRDGRIYSDEELANMPKTDREFMRRMRHDPTPEQRATGVVSRNAPCPCGSGKRFKRCCLFGGANAKPE